MARTQWGIALVQMGDLTGGLASSSVRATSWPPPSVTGAAKATP